MKIRDKILELIEDFDDGVHTEKELVDSILSILSQWINVNDELPDRPYPAGQCKEYLVTNGTCVGIARFTSAGYWIDMSCVTHWQKKPEPPK